MEKTTKSVALIFNVPRDVDLFSEQRAAYKAVIIKALDAYRSDYEGTQQYDPHTAKLVADLRTES